MSTDFAINLVYIVAAFCLTFGLKLLSSPSRARLGNAISSLGMLLAVVATLYGKGIVSFTWIAGGIAAGTLIGVFSAYMVAMTQMPQMVAILNGFGGVASLFVGWATYHAAAQVSTFSAASIFFAVLIGGLTFTGSLVAFGKLSGFISTKPVLFPMQKLINAVLLLAAIGGGVAFCMTPGGALAYTVFVAVMVLSMVLGVLAVISIGGADMPVVISLLNSYSGLAGCAAGFVVQNNILIVAGALVGASGIILTNIMCKSMNRSLANVLFSGFGSKKTSSGEGIKGEAKPINAADAYLILEAATSVVVVPGYGLAVAQAQHAVRELGELIEANGGEVKYAIHPVAGRMPGHMNVLLAEANVPYDQLVEMDDINPEMENVDVCLVIGANDVVNPAANEDKSSPIYGMPVINVDKARTVFVLKRSMASGFSGVDNPLFFKDNTRMLFGDAKASLMELVSEFKNAQK